MIQCLWTINNFKGYPPELQVSCMGVSKMISHMQQHFTDGNNLLITVCYPLPSKSSTPVSSTAPTGTKLLSPPHGSALQEENCPPGLTQSHSSVCPRADLSRATCQYLGHGCAPVLGGVPSSRGVCCRPMKGGGRALGSPLPAPWLSTNPRSGRHNGASVHDREMFL